MHRFGAKSLISVDFLTESGYEVIFRPGHCLPQLIGNCNPTPAHASYWVASSMPGQRRPIAHARQPVQPPRQPRKTYRRHRRFVIFTCQPTPIAAEERALFAWRLIPEPHKRRYLQDLRIGQGQGAVSAQGSGAARAGHWSLYTRTSAVRYHQSHHLDADTTFYASAIIADQARYSFVLTLQLNYAQPYSKTSRQWLNCGISQTEPHVSDTIMAREDTTMARSGRLP